MNQEMFREYDIRGVADEDIPNETAELIGKAIGTLIHNNNGKSIVVGRDNRISGPRILENFVNGVISTGINVTFIGEVPTPLLYYAVQKLDSDGGVNVTASHNPPEFNGFKVLVGKKAIYGEAIQNIYKLAKSKEFAKGEGKVNEVCLDEQYLEEIASIVSPEKKLKIIIDAGNGMASELAPKLLEKIGVTPECLFCEKDSSFPNHPPDPVHEENVKELISLVKEKNFDLGIAFDGDVDRIGVVDEKGTLLFGDQLLGIFAEDCLKRNPNGKIIFEVKCSQALDEWIKEKKGQPIMWKTGHSLIKAKMKEENAVLAGEMSGHMFFTEKWYGFDDALLAAVKIIEIVSKSKKTLSEMVEEMPKYVSSPEYRVDCPDSKKELVVNTITEKFIKIYPKSITLDGIRIIMDVGWALVRKSNTQPKIILRFEAKTQEKLEEIKSMILPEVERLIKE